MSATWVCRCGDEWDATKGMCEDCGTERPARFVGQPIWSSHYGRYFWPTADGPAVDPRGDDMPSFPDEHGEWFA